MIASQKIQNSVRLYIVTGQIHIFKMNCLTGLHFCLAGFPFDNGCSWRIWNHLGWDPDNPVYRWDHTAMPWRDSVTRFSLFWVFLNNLLTSPGSHYLNFNLENTFSPWRCWNFPSFFSPGFHYFCERQFMKLPLFLWAAVHEAPSIFGLILSSLFFSVHFIASHPAMGMPIKRKGNESSDDEAEHYACSDFFTFKMRLIQ